MAGFRWPAVPVVIVAAGVALGGCISPSEQSRFKGFTASPDPAETGQTVTFDGRQGSSETVPAGTKVSWDLDGDGRFETFTGTGNSALVASAAYPTPGFHGVGIDLGHLAGFGPVGFLRLAGIAVFLHEYATGGVTVLAAQPQPGQPPANQPPVATFEHDADPGYAETPVNFNAGGSSDPEGTVLTYEWDFGDTHSSDDTLTTKSPTASYRYDFSGDYVARLRVFDESGLAAETTRMVQVIAGTPPAPRIVAPSAAGAGRGTPFALTLDPSALTSEGMATVTNGALVRTGVVGRGRLTLGRRLARPLSRTRTPRWTARFMVKQRGQPGEAQVAVEGQMLIDFGRGVRVCTATRASFRGGRPADGRLSVIGGTGAGARVGGNGTFTVTLTDKLRVIGRVRFAQRRRARALPPECRTLLRISRRRG